MSKILRQFNEFPEWVNYDPNDGKYVATEEENIPELIDTGLKP